MAPVAAALSRRLAWSSRETPLQKTKPVVPQGNVKQVKSRKHHLLLRCQRGGRTFWGQQGKVLLQKMEQQQEECSR